MSNMIERLKRKLFHSRKRAFDRANNPVDTPVLTILLSPLAYLEIVNNPGEYLDTKCGIPKFEGYVFSICPNQTKAIRIVER